MISVLSLLLLGAFKYAKKTKRSYRGKKYVKLFPAPLLVLGVCAAIVAAAGWTTDDRPADGVSIVGDVPSGLPTPVNVFSSPSSAASNG